MRPILYYVHDPMCSWCWGFSHVLSQLLEHLPHQVEVRRLLGGLAADTDTPMPDSMQQYVKNNWKRIEDTVPGIKFNFDFWDRNAPRRSTYPACRAVIAARQQGEKHDILMTTEIQNAYYQQALNPSDNSVLFELAVRLNLSPEQFKKDLTSEKTQNILMDEINMVRELYVENFPSLVLKKGDKIYPIKLDYNNSSSMLGLIQAALIS